MPCTHTLLCTRFDPETLVSAGRGTRSKHKPHCSGSSPECACFWHFHSFLHQCFMVGQVFYPRLAALPLNSPRPPALEAATRTEHETILLCSSHLHSHCLQSLLRLDLIGKSRFSHAQTWRQPRLQQREPNSLHCCHCCATVCQPTLPAAKCCLTAHGRTWTSHELLATLSACVIRDSASVFSCGKNTFLFLIIVSESLLRRRKG